MIFELLLQTATINPDRLFVADSFGQLTYGEALQQAREIRQTLTEGDADRIYFYAPDSRHLILTLIATDALGIEACVLNREFGLEEVLDRISRLGSGWILTDVSSKEWSIQHVYTLEGFGGGRRRDEGPKGDFTMISEDTGSSDGKIIILTTGTTGRPKAALYTWNRLIAQGRHIPGEENARWLLVYPLNHFAGMQLLVHVLLNGASLVVPSSRRFDDVLDCLRYCDVDSVSATPTFWRMFTGRLTKDLAQNLLLKRITLGGEVSTPEVLRRLQALFPNASISQVYAITELGSCFSVKDGRPGFPKSYLYRPVGNVELKIIEGELYLKSHNRMLGYLGDDQPPQSFDEWIATGDLVEVVEDRVLFRGRKSEIINVGGVKVYPLKVEEVILQAEEVQGARVYGKSNPVTGQIVAADVEVNKGIDTSSVVDKIHQFCRAELSRYEQPRHIRIVDSLAKQNEKVVRRT